jgi:CheY-like chemotaxis protein
MARFNINLRDLVILVADPSSYMSMLIHSMLRGFGSNKVLEARSSTNVLQVLTNQKIDILICDSRLPPHGGLPLTRAIRRKQDNANRTIPILVMTSDGRETTVKLARDAGANMVIAKPMSPGSLYDRLAWIAFNPRQFVDTPTYFGPDQHVPEKWKPAFRKGTCDSTRIRGGRPHSDIRSADLSGRNQLSANGASARRNIARPGD